MDTSTHGINDISRTRGSVWEVMWCDKPDYNRQATIYEIVALQTELFGNLNKKAGEQTQPNLYGITDVGSLREEQDAHPI